MGEEKYLQGVLFDTICHGRACRCQETSGLSLAERRKKGTNRLESPKCVTQQSWWNTIVDSLSYF